MAVVSACELLIGGMTCTACTGAVQGALLKHPGVIEAEVDILRETARVAYESGSVTPDSLCNVVQNVGFDAQVLQIFFSNANSQTTSATRNASDSACKSPTDQQYPQGQRETFQADCAKDREDHVESASTFFAGSKTRPLDLTATIRFGLQESGAAGEACRRLESIQGVLNCSLLPTKRLSGHESIQLTVTYRPDIVGARQLTKVMEQQGICFRLLTEDLLEPQEVVPGLHLSTVILLLLTTPIQFYGGRSFHAAALKGLRHRHLSMDLLISLGSTSAYVYSVISCIHTAVTNLWCRPLLLASAAAANSATATDTAFHEFLRNSDPQNFFDTCATLTCVVLFGKSQSVAQARLWFLLRFTALQLLQLGAKARILTQLHSLHDLQATNVRLVQRSSIPAVASQIPPAEERSFCGRMAGILEQQEPHDAFMKVPSGIAEGGEPMKPASVTRWWDKLTSALDPHRRQHRYNPLFHPGAQWVEDEEASEAPALPACCKKRGKDSPKKAANEIQEEVSISAELLQVGDVVRVAPNEVIPADGILLAPEVLHLDEKLVSGEGRAVARFANQRVIGGSRNASCTDGYVRVEVVGNASVLQTLLRLVYDAQQQQVSLQKTAASFASYFIPCVLCVTVAAIITWMIKVFAASDATPLSPLQHMRHRLRETELKEGILGAQQQASILQHLQYTPQQQQLHDPINMFLAAPGGRLSQPPTHLPPAATVFTPANTAAAAAACKLSSWAVAWDNILFALRFGVAVCCAACPCAIGLAAPAAVAAATAAAAARGIFFKSGTALETAAKVNLLVLDKTGTLTTGELQVAACAVDKIRVAELLMPAVTGAGRSGTGMPSGKAELLDAIDSGSGTNIPGKSCCCTGSTINTSSGTSNNDAASFSDSALGSVSLDVTLEDTAGGSQHSQDAVLIEKQAEVDVQHSTKSSIAETSTLHAGAEAPEGTNDPHKKVAYINLKDLWNIPFNDISASSGQSQQQGNCCGSNRREGPQGGHRGPPHLKIRQVSPAELNSETATATDCFLWALSCLEQGSNHAVGMALISAYDRWLRASSGSMQEGEFAAAAEKDPPQRCRLPQRCEEILLLPRGVEGFLRPTQHGPTLRLRVVAASSEDGGGQERKCCAQVSNRCSYSDEESGDLQAWTEWHESNTGPVVSLHAFVPSSHNDPKRGSWAWLGSVALRDKLQDEAKAAICTLRQSLGFRIFMCTGDNPRTAARVAASFGIPLNCVRAQQRPADKVAFLRFLQSSTDPNIIDQKSLAADKGGNCSPLAPTTVEERNPGAQTPVCCMIGDGLNDAPALAAAALGVAFGVGSALPVAAADVAVGGNSWTELVDLFRIAKKMRSIIQCIASATRYCTQKMCSQLLLVLFDPSMSVLPIILTVLFKLRKPSILVLRNFLWACAFNLIAVPLAAGIAYPMVSLHPAAAAAAMAGSCLLVLLNAQRLSRFKATTHEAMKGDLLVSRLKARTETSSLEAEEEALVIYPSPSESFSPPSLQSSDERTLPNESLQQISPCEALPSPKTFCPCSKACVEACSTRGHEENPLSGTSPSSLLSDTSASAEALEFDVKTDEHTSFSGCCLPKGAVPTLV